MAVERGNTDANLIDVLARVLDKSIILDAWDRLRIALGNTRFVVASVEIQRTYGELAPSRAIVPEPPLDPGSRPDELGVREPRPDPKHPRAGAVAVNPHD